MDLFRIEEIMKKQAKIQISENQASKQVTDWLSLNHIFWFYVPNKGRYDNSRDKITPGAPDIITITEDNVIAIELKSTKGRQSAKQILFQDAFETASNRNIYIVARSIDDLMPVFGML